MVWKILSFLTAVCLGAACYFAWSNQKDLASERDRERFAGENLKAAQDSKRKGDAALVAKKAAMDSIQKELGTTKAETLKLAQDATEKEEALKLLKGNLEQIEQQVAAQQKQIEEAGDVEKLIAQIEKYKKEQAEAEAGVASETQRLASAKEQYESVVAQTTSLRDAEARGRKGVVDPSFTARVRQFFPQWHFAILSKGNSDGVFANADLDVKRGKEIIAKLRVMNVEQYGAVAEVVKGSLAKGEMIHSGDIVVASASQQTTKPAATGAAAAGSTPAPAAGAPAGNPSMDTTVPAAGAPAMGADPFGAAPAPQGAAPAAPAMGSDPFGAAPAPAGTTPAPAAPAMGSDPFGAAPAPAGTAPAPAAPAMGADPFGAAPAPKAGAAPAGTPAAPSTADPFGAAPAPKP
jgi:hypothetical protein